MKKKILVTCALPYANGDMHIGHMLEHIQSDIWVRYHKMMGNTVWFICADDSHGTAIMMKSQALNISPENLIYKIYRNHIQDLKNFNISYDYFSSTHSRENLTFVRKIYYKLKLNNFIQLKTISQLYDIEKNMFLPDRFIIGTCPICYKNNQYGDHCESCGSIYKAIELINPISNISNTQPIIRYSIHLFFNLSILKNFLYQWINSGIVNHQIINKIQEWFNKGLKLWNISRDTPYFGFQIPDILNKYFYVWFDAPIAYISTFKQLCNKYQLDFDAFWGKDSQTELYHFIGKDIIYFHILFWPAILKGIGFRLPSKIFVHGHVTFNGIKLSKSKKSFLTAKKWIKYFDSDSLRYYYASILSSKIEDIEFNLKDFIYKINSDIVNKIVNLASRSASFLNKYFNNILSDQLENKTLYEDFVNASINIKKWFINRDFYLVINKIVELSDVANQYFSDKQPWKLILECQRCELHKICSTVINLFRVIMTYLKPITPDLTKRTERFLLINLKWNDIVHPLLNHTISSFKPLYKRINLDIIHDMK